MKTNPWFRMYHEFATDPKVQMLCEVDQRRFVMLLCFRCCNGDVTLHDDAVTFQLRVTPDEWAATKARLVAKNLIDEDNKPVAWDRRQYVSDRSNERVIRHREKKKQECNVTVTAPEPEPEPESDLLPLPSEQVSPRESEVKDVFKNVGLGRGGSVSAEARRKVCAKLNVTDADPLVRIYEAWSGSSKAIDPDGLFISTAAKMFREASAEVKAACQPLAAEPIPIAARIARPSSSLIASLAGGSRHGLRRN